MPLLASQRFATLLFELLLLGRLGRVGAEHPDEVFLIDWTLVRLAIELPAGVG